MRIASYAKVNLFLEVLGKLRGNYHRIETLLCSVSLCDTVKYALTKKQGIKLWSNLPEMAADTNLIFRVASFIQEEFRPEQGVEIELEKRIPVAAGLGGGSSNAASTIKALNSLWNLKLSQARMEEIASRFGSDINFFLHGGTAWGRNRGEQIEPCEDLELDNILLINPNIGISSAAAYQKVSIPDEEERRVFRPEHWREDSFNRLETCIRAEYPEVDMIIDHLREAGARPAIMSGSGSTCFGIFEASDSLKECQRFFMRRGYWTDKVRTISRKEYQSVFEA